MVSEQSPSECNCPPRRRCWWSRHLWEWNWLTAHPMCYPSTRTCRAAYDVREWTFGMLPDGVRITWLEFRSWCKHTYIYRYIDTYIQTHIHAYTHTSIHRYIHTYIHTYLHTYIQTYIHTHLRTYIHTGRQAKTHPHTHTRAHTHIYI